MIDKCQYASAVRQYVETFVQGTLDVGNSRDCVIARLAGVWWARGFLLAGTA